MATDCNAPPSWTLFLHGSEISRAWLSEEQALHIVLSAAAAMPSSRTDRTDRTEGYLSGVTWVLSGAQGQFDPSLIMGGIAEGHVTTQGQLLRQLPAPSHQTGPLTLNLRLISGTHLSASGHSLRVELAPSAVFRESWAC
ncbi:MAG: hypothetical protein KGL57_11890 [Burkholderiales bacterium]|nr:hypothetical protein [Burkholderiales bacterium]